MSYKLPDTWPGLLRPCTPEVTMEPSMGTSEPRLLYSSTPPTQRVRFVLKSPSGFATENGFTDDPSSAIQIVDHESAMRRIRESGRSDLMPHLVHFQRNGDYWHPITT